MKKKRLSATVPAMWKHHLELFQIPVLYSNEETNFSTVKPFAEANSALPSNLFIEHIRFNSQLLK